VTQQTKKTGRAAAAVLWTLLPLALCALAVLSLGVGARPVSPDRVLAVLFFPDGSREALVVWQLRMPRTLLGIVAGAALGLAGGLMQALTRNPLADPGLVGVNAGAALCVVLAISLFGLTEYGATVGFALCGAGVASALVYVLGSGPREAGRQARLVLAGVAVSASFSAITGVITMLDSTASGWWAPSADATRPS
jgi:iron complex transport system permease protein